MTKAFTHDMLTTYRSTYRYLRWVMVAALLALFLSVLIQSVVANCWLGSVSAYYYTPARAVFVGSLIAFGAALIAYKGRAPEEDLALNFAGFMAIVVAMVPTVPDDLCPAAGFVLTEDEIAAAVVNNVWSLILTTLIAAVVLLVRWLLTRGRPGDAVAVDEEREGMRRSSRIRTGILSVLALAVLVLELWYFLVRPEVFIERSHGIAAITMVAGLILVMLFNAVLVKHQGAVLGLSFRGWYFGQAALLFALAGGVFVAGSPLVILILELVVFAVFVAYWVVQSIEVGRMQEGSEPAQLGRRGVGPRDTNAAAKRADEFVR